MALIVCHECKNQVSSEAKVCPTCGAKVKIPKPARKPAVRSGVWKLAGIFIGLVFLVQLYAAFQQSQKTPAELKQEADAKQEQETQQTAKKAEKDKKFAAEFKRTKAAAIAALSVKNASRNPESVSWTAIMTNDDASLVCMELRAQNGFGGMTVENVSVFNGKISTDDGPWNKHCANKKLFDVTVGTLAMLKRL